jgi:hypothetical protein
MNKLKVSDLYKVKGNNCKKPHAKSMMHCLTVMVIIITVKLVDYNPRTHGKNNTA